MCPVQYKGRAARPKFVAQYLSGTKKAMREVLYEFCTGALTVCRGYKPVGEGAQRGRFDTQNPARWQWHGARGGHDIRTILPAFLPWLTFFYM